MTEDQDLVIKPADKGGAICIQDAEKYKKEILRQLSDAEGLHALSVYLENRDNTANPPNKFIID